MALAVDDTLIFDDIGGLTQESLDKADKIIFAAMTDECTEKHIVSNIMVKIEPVDLATSIRLRGKGEELIGLQSPQAINTGFPIAASMVGIVAVLVFVKKVTEVHDRSHYDTL